MNDHLAEMNKHARIAAKEEAENRAKRMEMRHKYKLEKSLREAKEQARKEAEAIDALERKREAKIRRAREEEQRAIELKRAE